MSRVLDAVTLGPARRRRRMARALRALDRSDAHARRQGVDPLSAWRTTGPRDWTPASDPSTCAPRRRSGVRRHLGAWAVLVLVVVGGPLAVQYLPSRIAQATGSGSATSPPTGIGEQHHPLGHPPAAPAGTGGYAFETTQPDSTAPVTWDPCRAIHYVTAGTAPAGAQAVVPEAIARISAATGLTFVDDGPTTERLTSADRSPYQPARYGKRWAPLLVDWTSPAAVPGLTGAVIGQGGGQRVILSGQSSYVTGEVALDTAQLAGDLARSGNDPRVVALVRAVVMHELGHALGLAHVDDPHQIMYPEAQLQVTDLGPGDLRGLAQLGSGHCAPSL